MKNDLFTSILIAIIGFVAAFVVCNRLVGGIGPESIKTVDISVSADVTDPDVEVFNYKAINPTVEVYVGNNNGTQGAN